MTTDEQAIHDLVRQLETAWNASDSRGFAAPFTEDADFIQIYGLEMEGRPAIDSSHRHIFDTIYKGSHNSLSLRRVRFVRPDVAIAFGQAHLKFHESGETREIRSRPTMIVVKDQGRWQIVAFQNTRIAEMPAVVKGPGYVAS
jgi:uncharacterized protein (TIGR02246 family)